MRRLILAAALALSACSEPPPPEPVGPAAASWTDPSGRFSVEYGSHGWRPLTEAPPNDAVLELVHDGFMGQAEAVRMCAIYREVLPETPGVDQARALEIIARRSNDEFAASMGAGVSEVARVDQNGTVVIAFRGDRGGMRQYWRMFYIAVGDEILQMGVNCGGALPINDEEEANFRAVLETLTITPEANP